MIKRPWLLIQRHPFIRRLGLLIKCLWQNIKKWPFRYRKTFLVLAAILGILLAASWQTKGLGDFLRLDVPLRRSLTLLFLGLPTFFLLWVFRTHDVQENINNSTFFECARLLASRETYSEKVALEQLAYLKNETGFNKERIDLLTRNISLSKGIEHELEKMPYFSLVQFRNLDLSYADLRYINLRRADLSGTDLREAYLSGADLTEAILTGTNLQDAYYNSQTRFPEGFDPYEADMILKSD